MTDPVSVAATYIVVIGGVAGYLASLRRRARAARRHADAIERERLTERDASARPQFTAAPGGHSGPSG